MPPTPPIHRRRLGFSLPEVLLASVILAIVSLTLTQAIVAGQTHAYHALDTHRAAALADSLLERVLALPYEDPDGDSAPGPERGEDDPSAFDNVDDYHGHVEPAGQLVNPAGARWPDAYQGYARSVRVVEETLDVADLGGSHLGQTVTVTVTQPDGRLITSRRWVASGVE
jgi:prepilin-type N-terminal cleavage/methylation domain-containing protein